MVRRSTWILLVIFIALLAGALLWQRYNTGRQAEITPTPAPGEESLLKLDGQVASIRISDAAGNSVDVGRDQQGQWKLVWPKAEATDIAKVEQAVTQLVAMRALSVLEQSPGLAATGLQTPAYGILLNLDNGKQVVINIGKPTPTGTGYYVLMNDRKMYVVDKYSLDSVLNLLAQPPVAQTAEPPALLETPAP